MGGYDIVDYHVAAGCGSGYHESARLYLVGDNGVIAAMQLFHALDPDGVGACALNICAEHIKEISNVNNVRLLRGVGNYRCALCTAGGEHYVDRCANACHVKVDLCTVQLVGVGIYYTVFD